MNINTYARLAEGYKNFRSGDPISDEQLVVLIHQMVEAENILSAFGNDHNASLRCLRLDLSSLRSMQDARKRG